MRSLTPITSSMSLEIIRIADAPVGELAHQLVDLVLGADVDAAGRLVEDDHARLHRQPARQHDLLLVAAGERAHLGVATEGVLMFELPLLPLGVLRLRPAADQRRRA